ncbi:MAG: hypothetical protein M3Z26_01930 [Bacteroidota bacterium]|nr:hypothetical protein [Bacteroidota bacterium]
MQKYKVIIRQIIVLIALVIAFIDHNNLLKDFFLGAASVAVLINLDESIGNLKKEKNEDELSEEKYISNK